MLIIKRQTPLVFSILGEVALFQELRHPNLVSCYGVRSRLALVTVERDVAKPC